MKRLGDAVGSIRKPLLGAAGILGFTTSVVFWLLYAMPGRALSPSQNTAAVAPEYRFETVSIKPTKSDCSGSFIPGYTVDGYRAECVTVRNLIRTAYDVKDYGVSGNPDWVNTELFNVEAKAETSVADALSKLTPEQLKLARQGMLQALLAERFNLKIHRETKDEPVYLLVVGKNGPKFQNANSGDTHTFPGADGSAVRGQIALGAGSEGGRTAKGHSVSMKLFADYLSLVLGRPVLDRTGLTGAYDFTLEWTPDATQTPAPDPAIADSRPGLQGASIFSAVQEQLGLKLEPGKGPVELIVIDHIEKPSRN